MARLSTEVDLILKLLGKTGEALFAVGGWMIFIGATGLLVLAPYWGARILLQWTQTHFPAWLHAIILGLAFCLLLLWAWSITGVRGSKLFNALGKHGIKLPILFSVALLFFAIVCFSSLSSWLNDLDVISFKPALARANLSKVQDFYLWHFLDSIPGLQVPQTLLWNEPMKYQSPLPGVLLLMFKIFVIIPVIGSFATWNKVRKERAPATPSSTEQHTSTK